MKTKKTSSLWGMLAAALLITIALVIIGAVSYLMAGEFIGILAWDIIAIFAGVLAYHRYRNALGWYMLSLLISPVFTILGLIFLEIGRAE